MALGKNSAVVERAILIWSNMVKMCKFWAGLTKPIQTQCKSYETPKIAVIDQFMIIKFEFFNFKTGMLEPFLRMYETDSPMISFMYLQLKDLIRNLLNWLAGLILSIATMVALVWLKSR